MTRSRSGWDVLVIVPVTFALIAGVIYAAGAIVLTSRIEAAGYSAADIVPFVPVQTMRAATV